MLGTMVGDALGMPGEGLTREQLQTEHGRLDSLREGRLPAGEYTDDTEMTLNLCESLLREGDFELRSVASNLAHGFTPWRGYSPHVYGIMAKIRQGMRWEIQVSPSWGVGAATRVAPLGVLYAPEAVLADHAARQAEITHAHANAVAGAVAQAKAVGFATEQGLLETTVGTDDALATLGEVLEDYSVAMLDAVMRIRDLPQATSPEALSGAISKAYPCDGSAVGTVPAALASFMLADGFEDAVIIAVNCGGATDALGAMTGALAGAFYGASAIPERLTAGLTNDERGRDHLVSVGTRLGQLARQRNGVRLEGD
jgi:poly(ADP-ribose) glycohydrolase ARH3